MNRKRIELNRAKDIIKTFCKKNGINNPITKTSHRLDCLGCYYDNGSKEIFIDLLNNGLSTRINNPAMIKESTITGTLVHEFAHYIHYTLSELRGPLRKQFKKLKEPLIHYWETDIDEDIAESIRLFILNPTLLKEGRPKRYKILNKYFEPINSHKHYTQLLEDIDSQKKKAIHLWLERII